MLFLSQINQYIKVDLSLRVLLATFHHFVHGVLKTQMPRTTTRKIIYRSFKHFNPEDFGSDLRKAPFHVGEVLDIHSHMEYFQDLFLNILDQHAPVKSKVIRTSQCPHMTKKWKSTMYQRNMAYNTYRQNKSNSNFEKFRVLRNISAQTSQNLLLEDILVKIVRKKTLRIFGKSSNHISAENQKSQKQFN